MADIARYNPVPTPNPITEYLQSVEGVNYAGQPNVLIMDDSTPARLVLWNQARGLRANNISMKYWKFESGSILEMTSSEKTAVDAAEAAIADAATRLGAKQLIVGFSIQPLLLRALADILKDEINIIRGWTVSFKAQVALATTLADLKVRVATLPTLSDRTLAQLRTAIQNRIDDRSVDN